MGDQPSDDGPREGGDPSADLAGGEGDDGADGPDDGEDGATPGDGGSGPPDPRAEDPDRRGLLRWIIVVAIGIPVLIELRTFLGLAGVIGGGEDTPTATPTPAGDRVGVGDELLPATGPAETVTEATVTARDDGDWPFTLAVRVDNDDDGEYQLRLGAVRTGAGDTVDGGAETPRLDPGESTTLTAEWALPPGAAPEAVQVSGVTYEDGAATGQVSETVRLADVPVRGG